MGNIIQIGLLGVICMGVIWLGGAFLKERFEESDKWISMISTTLIIVTVVVTLLFVTNYLSEYKPDPPGVVKMQDRVPSE